MSDQLPTGTVTFLFTDVQGSTRKWEEDADAMRPALERHDAHGREAIAAKRGQIVKTTGDGFHAVFSEARDAVAAAVAFQSALLQSGEQSIDPIRIRIGIHSGEADLRDGDYYGPAVNRAARLMAAAHGGQIVCSATTADLVADQLSADIGLLDLGEHRLRDLTRTERVFQVTHPNLPSDFPDLRTIDTLPGNLPVLANRFVGRAKLVSDVATRLERSPVITLTGPGGVGKTRLALQVAASAQPWFSEGAWFVDLASVTDRDGVAPLVLKELDFVLSADEDPVNGLCSRLRRRRILLVLDNCEQVTAGVAAVAEAISRAAEDARIIATSREGLGIAAEQVLPIPPLDIGPDGDAVRLFELRAQASRPNFVIEDSGREVVMELCRRLDGIPLAIELAAARARTLTPAQILARLDERFRILTGGLRTAAPRHQTLQAAVDWSYDLLSSDEQVVLNRLSVFAGGFTLDAAEATIPDADMDQFVALDCLDALVDKSLVVAEDAGSGRRYRLLETIRQYAGDRLARTDDADRTRARHAAHYLDHASRLSSTLLSATGTDVLDELEAEVDNLAQMLEWHLDHGEGAKVIDAIVELEPFIFSRDHQHWAMEYLHRALVSDLDDRGQTYAFAMRAWFGANLGFNTVPEDVQRAESAAERAGILLPMPAQSARHAHAMVIGDEAAVRLAEEAADEAYRRGEHYWALHAQCSALMFRAVETPQDPLLPQALRDLERDVTAAGSPRLRQAYTLAAGISAMTNDREHALSMLDESLRLAIELGTGHTTADAHFFLSLTHLRDRDPVAAARHCRMSLVGHHDGGHVRGTLMCLSSAAGLAVLTSRTQQGRLILDGLRRARVDLKAPGSTKEQEAERRIAALCGIDAGETSVLGSVPDFETTIDLALDVLAEISDITH